MTKPKGCASRIQMVNGAQSDPEIERRRIMNRMFAVMALLPVLLATPVWAGDADVKAAQATIDAQINAFRANDDAKAYSYAAPGIQRIFPTVDAFIGMVERAYQPVWHPKSYTFGPAEQDSATSVTQHVFVVGPDGKNYEAVYTLELQPDGVFRIKSVSLRASNTLST
jgi:hypothetical protein